MKIGIIANKNYFEKISPFFGGFLDWLKKNNIDFCVEAEFADIAGYPHGTSIFTMMKISDLLIVLGGDGTILRAARLMRNNQIPMLGIRFGRLGFLAELSGQTYEKGLIDILKGEYRLDERMVLEAQIGDEPELLYALNDVVIFRSHSSKLITLDVHIDNDYMNTFRSDGMIIASPTGSTAYSLSCGGPIVTPGISAIIINPICPHMLSNRPTLVSGDSKILIRFEELEDGCTISVDGQQDIIAHKDTVIKIKQAPYKVKLVRSVNNDFFSVVRNKLKWTQ
ncbi:MAG: NAD(+)/NADH kinase [Candidatus Marinimicrobia bacterium]|nr:NAD(+)/NADH kinase [Candidatus Neomarinimicrobiota bacterium]